MNNLVSQYISKITINNINDFALKNNIVLNKKELDILFDVVKNRYREILSGNVSGVSSYLKDNLSSENYLKIINLYEDYFRRYGNYL